MSDSDTDDEFTTKPLQKLLEHLYDDLTDAAISAKKIYKTAKEPQDLFTHPFKLTKAARAVLEERYMSMERILDSWIPKWRKEGRLSANGYWIRLGATEAELLGFAAESEHDVYRVASHLTRLFEVA
jgi:hypothetical protein